MSKNRELKEKKVQEIKEVFESAKAAVVLDYQGLTVSDATELRNSFRKEDVQYHVFKNRLVKLAVEGTEFEKLADNLTGPNGIAFAMSDATSAARVAKEFAKKNNKLELKMGVVDGVFYDGDMIKKIADIPSKEVLIAKFMGSIKAPVTKFAAVVKAIAESKGE